MTAPPTDDHATELERAREDSVETGERTPVGSVAFRLEHGREPVDSSSLVRVETRDHKRERARAR